MRATKKSKKIIIFRACVKFGVVIFNAWYCIFTWHVYMHHTYIYIIYNMYICVCVCFIFCFCYCLVGFCCCSFVWLVACEMFWNCGWTCFFLWIFFFLISVSDNYYYVFIAVFLVCWMFGSVMDLFFDLCFFFCVVCGLFCFLWTKLTPFFNANTLFR